MDGVDPILESCCWKVYFDFEDMNLQPGREDWVRHQDCINELVAMVRDTWIEECGGCASDWPWNTAHVMQTFIRVRKQNVQQKAEARAKMNQGSLFPIPPQGIIYFIQNSRGQVKIGWTGGEPERRLKQLQTAEAEDVHLIGWMEGSERQESALHVRFAAFRMRGEWFHQNDELKELIHGSNRPETNGTVRDLQR